ncbi:hypothetical protein BZA05DRAFT_406894 [Tricharina praecox]|uniref:uncharacterized protein n=1 Tax=Tricharina praecox TaxID=43433 RepID=UPI002220706B|nr:uncharacterized protein BZA05DRAFT_406894 [Tricharina praecox]KAI5846076.1 hypothetical protein BZA05DRAFT_406894 [Tricharina praecox]
MPTDTTTLVVAYVVYAICFLLMPLRLFATYTRTHRWRTDDYWMAFALCVLIVRAVATPIVLNNRTNNFGSGQEVMSEGEIGRREFGSKIVIVVRACYAVFIWCMKFCVLAFYGRIVVQLRQYERFIKPLWVVLAATFVAAILSTFLEWQVLPSPSHHCTTSEIQLYTTGACNLTTDLLLLGFILPIILRLNLPLRTKIQIATLFSLGVFVMIITIIRLPFVVRNQALQQWRTLFANFEILASCIVANAPVLYRIIKDTGYKSSGGSSDTPREGGGYVFEANRGQRRGGIMSSELGSGIGRRGSLGIGSLMESARRGSVKPAVPLAEDVAPVEEKQEELESNST